MKDAIFTGVETRTSSPVRIKRDDISFESINTRGLYPLVKVQVMRVEFCLLELMVSKLLKL